MNDLLTDLCLALSMFGSVPDGHIELIIETKEIQVSVSTPEEKELIVRLLCADREFDYE